MRRVAISAGLVLLLMVAFAVATGDVSAYFYGGGVQTFGVGWCGTCP